MSTLTDKLSHWAARLTGSVLTEGNMAETLSQVRMSLLEADVALPVVKDFVERVAQQAEGQKILRKIGPAQALLAIVQTELTALLGGAQPAKWATGRAPYVVLLAGLQGVGKTTTAAKLARYAKTQMKKRVLLVSTDIRRLAAREQLALLAQQVDVSYWGAAGAQTPVAIGLSALAEAHKKLYDLLIVDTSGRLAVDQELMDELSGLHQALKPAETLLVLDAMQGQDALRSAELFHRQLSLQGLVMTKTDGDARGGAVISARAATGVPIRFIGVSEKPDGLELFHPDRVAQQILGMGDVRSLVEKFEANTNSDKVRKTVARMEQGRFNLNDLKSQLMELESAGGLEALAAKLPQQLRQQLPSGQNTMLTKQTKKMLALISSMTAAERLNPELLKASRKRRVAAGSGCSVSELNQMLTRVEQMQKMFKGGGKGLMQRLLGGR